MTPYASLTDLAPVARHYEVLLPDDEASQRALDLAAHDCDLWLSGPVALELLTAPQLAALRDGVAIQACFRLSMLDDLLGTDDGIAAVGGISFSGRPTPRMSVEATRRLAATGLSMRSGCAVVDPPRAARAYF